MEGGYDVSNTVENQSLDHRDSITQEEIPNADRIYQQQHSQHQIQNQSTVDRPTEIPAAKVCNSISSYNHLYSSSSVYIHTAYANVFKKKKKL